MNMVSGHNKQTKYLEKIGGKSKWIIWRNTVGRHDGQRNKVKKIDKYWVWTQEGDMIGEFDSWTQLSQLTTI